MAALRRSLLVPGLVGFATQPALGAAAKTKAVELAAGESKAKGRRRIRRTQVETGSLAKRKRQFFTKTEWDKIAAAAREGAQDQLDRNLSKPGRHVVVSI